MQIKERSTEDINYVGTYKCITLGLYICMPTPLSLFEKHEKHCFSRPLPLCNKEKEALYQEKQEREIRALGSGKQSFAMQPKTT